MSEEFSSVTKTPKKNQKKKPNKQKKEIRNITHNRLSSATYVLDWSLLIVKFPWFKCLNLPGFESSLRIVLKIKIMSHNDSLKLHDNNAQML